METEANKILVLVGEWREILRNQRQIEELREIDGQTTGALVGKDDLARRFQALQKRAYEIKQQLLGEYYLDAGA